MEYRKFWNICKQTKIWQVAIALAENIFSLVELFPTLFLKFKVPFHFVDVFNGYSFYSVN